MGWDTVCGGVVRAGVMRRCLQTTAARKSGKVVITGGAGNIGTKLAAHLVGVGYVHVEGLVGTWLASCWP